MTSFPVSNVGACAAMGDTLANNPDTAKSEEDVGAMLGSGCRSPATLLQSFSVLFMHQPKYLSR